jgi:AraC-like DNA-binding protein
VGADLRNATLSSPLWLNACLRGFRFLANASVATSRKSRTSREYFTHETLRALGDMEMSPQTRAALLNGNAKRQVRSLPNIANGCGLARRGRCSFTKAPVTLNASKIGYEDPNSFRRIFQRVTSLSPGDYRRRFAVTLRAAE